MSATSDGRRPELEPSATDEDLLASAPTVSSAVSVRFEPSTRGYVLVAPARAFVLNATATEVVLRCSGERALAAIIEELAAESEEPARVRAEVIAFVRELLRRGVLELRGERARRARSPA